MKLSAINDEISDDFEEQLRILKSNFVSHIELRKIRNKYLWEFSKEELYEFKKMIDKFSLTISLIDSPIGKHDVPTITGYFEIAKLFKCKYIRIFYNNDLNYLNEIAKKYDVILLIENEKNIIPENISEINNIIKKYSNIKLLFDIENSYSLGYDIMDSLIHNIDNIEYLHLRNIKNGKYVKLQEGNIEYTSILNYLKQVNFSGFISAEFHFPLNKDKENKSNMFVKQINDLNNLIKGEKI